MCNKNSKHKSCAANHVATNIAMGVIIPLAPCYRAPQLAFASGSADALRKWLDEFLAATPTFYAAPATPDSFLYTTGKRITYKISPETDAEEVTAPSGTMNIVEIADPYEEPLSTASA